ncbi:MAG: 4-alpha-glucanotransferase [Candidatus Sabulitectum sp.]|nr:4-alpha-glucanotransferase [Candidatus Sabulitectum sp.]
MLFAEETGVLLHPTSLPGKWGIGTLGSEASQFIRWMADSGFTVWQVLPLSPPVHANSPYQALSSFAGNPLLISLEELFKLGLLSSAELASSESVCSPVVSRERLQGRIQLLKLAATRALKAGLAGFEEFSLLPWVKEWSLFATEKEMNGGTAWTLRRNTSPAPEGSQRVHSMIQYFFHLQWARVKEECNSLGIRILGDIPIYTAHDSSDVFFNRELFKLNQDGMPSVVAGVPPDYFSSTGQLWGNPVYDWDACAQSGYRWWTSRMAAALQLFDAVRIDHFRGFAEYWEVPAGEKTAVNGKWVKGPGIKLFTEMEKALGKLPVVAENLGLITPSVHELRKLCGFPGMVVLQFALMDPDFSIASVEPATVIYTGTHDNDTTAGWIEKTGRQLGFNSVSSVVDLALASPAYLAVIPMQDILELGSSARMNTPSVASGNWNWRMTELPAVRSFSRSG